jgi:hypothetical protein
MNLMAIEPLQEEIRENWKLGCAACMAFLITLLGVSQGGIT